MPDLSDVTQYRLSSYVVRGPADQSVWRQQYTAETLGINPALSAVIDEILNGRDADASSGNKMLAGLVAAELAERGFLVPAGVASEERVLDDVHPLKFTSGLFGFPRAHLRSLPKSGKPIIFGVPCDLGATHAGAGSGPALMRRASKRLGWQRGGLNAFNVNDGGNPFEAAQPADLGDVILRGRDLATWMSTVEHVACSVAEGDVPIMLGGDHAFTYAAIAGVLRARNGRPFTILQFDQHLDVQFKVPFAEDRPVFLPPIAHHNFVSHLHELNPNLRIVQAGIEHYKCADANKREETVRYIKAIAEQISDFELCRNSLDRVMTQIGGDQDVYITIDVDVFPRDFISCTGFPASFGVPFDRVLAVIESVCAANRIIGIDIMEFGVPEHVQDKTSAVEAYRLDVLLAQILEKLPRRSPDTAGE